MKDLFSVIDILAANIIIPKKYLFADPDLNEMFIFEDIKMAKNILILREGIELPIEKKNSILQYLTNNRIDNRELFEYLIDNGANIGNLYFDFYNINSENILEYFLDNIDILNEKQLEMLTKELAYAESLIAYKLFIELYKRRKIDINSKNEIMLRTASYYGNYNMVKFLARRAKNINAYEPKFSFMMEPEAPSIMSAIHRGNHKIVKCLIENGATHIFTGTQQSLVTLSIHARRKPTVDFLKYLLEINARCYTEEEDTYLMKYAGELGSIDFLVYLEEMGVNIFVANNCIMKEACSHGHIDIIKYLIGRGMNINSSIDKYERTALSYAVQYDIKHNNGVPYLSKYLIEKGAIIDEYVLGGICVTSSPYSMKMFKYIIEECRADISGYGSKCMDYCVTECRSPQMDFIYYFYQKGYWFTPPSEEDLKNPYYEDPERNFFRFIRKVNEGTYETYDDIPSYDRCTSERYDCRYRCNKINDDTCLDMDDEDYYDENSTNFEDNETEDKETEDNETEDKETEDKETEDDLNYEIIELTVDEFPENIDVNDSEVKKISIEEISTLKNEIEWICGKRPEGYQSPKLINEDMMGAFQHFVGMMNEYYEKRKK